MSPRAVTATVTAAVAKADGMRGGETGSGGDGGETGRETEGGRGMIAKGPALPRKGTSTRVGDEAYIEGICEQDVKQLTTYKKINNINIPVYYIFLLSFRYKSLRVTHLGFHHALHHECALQA